MMSSAPLLQVELCPRLLDRQSENDPKCKMEGCKFTHDIQQYLDTSKLPSLGDECYVFNTRGHCPRGVACRYGSKHLTKDGFNVVNEALYAEWLAKTNIHTTNGLNCSLHKALRSKTYDFEKSEKILLGVNENAQGSTNSTRVSEISLNEADWEAGVLDVESDYIFENTNIKNTRLGPVLDIDIVNQRAAEKKKIDWRGKLILAPMTTLGNLPFRRLCKQFGADVTISEMALASFLLQGDPLEWAITRRHGSEDIFGLQVCGASPGEMTRCAQLLQEQTDVDFIDLNVGCPIDRICNQGAGCGLLTRKEVLFTMAKSMKSVLDIPLSVKTRMGLQTGEPTVHTMVGDLSGVGVDVVMIHGRSKEQRYSNIADWDYIEKCAQLAAPMSVVGNGDILSYEDYDIVKEKCPTAAAVMIGRGALIKPWIFTEIKERRHWDISSQERFQILRDYTNYGLEHWGSDTKGVETTRKFLLEWLSFLFRYLPVGLMEKPPQKMNERVPKFEGRDELECLMASPNASDWIKISEMLLGPVADGFEFTPKHKANAWSPNQ